MKFKKSLPQNQEDESWTISVKPNSQATTSSANSTDRKRKNPDDDEEVSLTQLTLSCGTSLPWKKTKVVRDVNKFSRSAIPAKPMSRNDFLASRIASFRHVSPEEEEEDRRMGVTTRLALYYDPWTIKKRLTESDLGNLSRLLLGKELVETHVIPMLGPVRAKEIQTEKGTGVTIWDCDRDSEHELTLKRWSTNKSYVLINGWRQEFVKQRELKQGDVIGLFWDPYKSRFTFRVLDRAPRQKPALG